MSLKTLLERFVRGLPLPSTSGYGEAFYSDDESDIDISPAQMRIDQAELQERRLMNETKIVELKKQIANEKQEREAAIAAKQQSEIETRLQLLEKGQQGSSDQNVSKAS